MWTSGPIERENSCITYRCESHLHKCHVQTNKHNDGTFCQAGFFYCSCVVKGAWVEGMDVSLSTSGLNSCRDVWKKSRKGKASICFAIFRHLVSFSSWLKHLHVELLEQSVSGTAPGCSWPVRAGAVWPGFAKPGPDSAPVQSRGKQMLWNSAGWKQAKGKRDPHFSSLTSPGHSPAPSLEQHSSHIGGYPWRTATPNTGCNGVNMAKPEPLGLPSSPFSPSFITHQVLGRFYRKYLFSKNDLTIHYFHF